MCNPHPTREGAKPAEVFDGVAALCFVRVWVHHAAMNRIDIQPPLVSIEEDFALWCAQQGALLRAGRLSAIDRENLAEEVESLGRSERKEISSRLEVLILHLLKWQFQPGRRSESWRISISEQRIWIPSVIKYSPSLKRYPAHIFKDAYEHGRQRAIDETGMMPSVFPEEPPFTVSQALDPKFLPGEPFAPWEVVRD